MLGRIGLWALSGCAVALLWALAFYVFSPANGVYPSQAALWQSLHDTPLLPITAPVALLGHHYAFTWGWSAMINAVIYGFIGMTFESIRMVFRARLRTRGI